MLRRHFIGLRRTLHSAPAPAWPSEPNSARSSTAPSADSRHWAGVVVADPRVPVAVASRRDHACAIRCTVPVATPNCAAIL
jgi:hypothetical protein